jgi:hypothetical protein
MVRLPGWEEVADAQRVGVGVDWFHRSVSVLVSAGLSEFAGYVDETFGLIGADDHEAGEHGHEGDRSDAADGPLDLPAALSTA